jgi:hypothetical protein
MVTSNITSIIQNNAYAGLVFSPKGCPLVRHWTKIFAKLESGYCRSDPAASLAPGLGFDDPSPSVRSRLRAGGSERRAVQPGSPSPGRRRAGHGHHDQNLNVTCASLLSRSPAGMSSLRPTARPHDSEPCHHDSHGDLRPS